MGYPAATIRGTSRTDATHARDLAPTAFRRRNSSGISRRQEGRRFQLSLNRAACFFLRAVHGAAGERGESPLAQKHGAVCADRLAKKRTARASGIFIGTITCRQIKRGGELPFSPAG